ncbi:MAG: BON domain-containing protein [Burkholderiales bacterium]
MIPTTLRTTLLAMLVASATLLAACDRDDTSANRADRSTPAEATPPDRATTRAAAAVEDAAITAKVKAAVLAEPGLKSLAIDVETNDGVVTLAGTVASPDLRQRAVTLAQQVEGVRSVSDQLVVKPA